MAVPVFVQAGTGMALTTGTGTVSLTGCVADNVVMLHAVIDGTTFDLGFGNVVNVTSAFSNDFDDIITGGQIGSPQTASSIVKIGRVVANGTCSADFTVGASGEDIFARMYEFSGVAAGTVLANLVENVGGVGGIYTQVADSSTSVGDASVVTGGPARLALAFVGIDDDQAVGSFTGETGGDWTEAVAEFASATGTQACLQLQTAVMASAGTIDGGTATIGVSSGWGTVGTALIPATLSDTPAVAWIRA